MADILTSMGKPMTDMAYSVRYLGVAVRVRVHPYPYPYPCPGPLTPTPAPTASQLCYLLHGEWLMPYEMQGGCAEWWFFSAVLTPNPSPNPNLNP